MTLMRMSCLVAVTLTTGWSQEDASAPLVHPSEQTSALSSAAWRVLDKGLSDANPEKRRQAIMAVGSLGPTKEALKLVEHALLNDKDTVTRQTAAAVLGEMKTPDAIPILKQALEDTTEVSFTAAESLWKLGDKSGREVFQAVLEGEAKTTPGMVKGAVRDAKHKLRNPSILAMMGVQEAAGTLLGPASMGIVVAKDAMKDSGSPGRVLAAKYLGEDPDPYALTLLEWALDDKGWSVRSAVAKALGQRGNAGTIPKLQPLLNDGHPAVAYMAAASIIRLSSPLEPALSSVRTSPAGVPVR